MRGRHPPRFRSDKFETTTLSAALSVMGDAPLTGGTVTCDVCGSVRTACAVWKRSMTALSFGANRQHSSTASPPPSLSMNVFQHHSPKEGSAAEKFRDHGRWLVEVSADRLYGPNLVKLKNLARLTLSSGLSGAGTYTQSSLLLFDCVVHSHSIACSLRLTPARRS